MSVSWVLVVVGNAWNLKYSQMPRMHCYAFNPQPRSSIIQNLPICPSADIRTQSGAGGQRWGSVLCTGWCKTGRSAWNHCSKTSWYVSRPKNASRGPTSIYYSLTDGPYIAKYLPVHLGDSLSFSSKKNILMCSVSCHWLECSIYRAIWPHRTLFLCEINETMSQV